MTRALAPMHGLMTAALMAFLPTVTVAQFLQQANAEVTMRQIMPPASRCGRFPWEPVDYCRYDNRKDGGVVLEIAYGFGAPAASLTYFHENAGGHRLLKTVRRFFLEAGVPEKDLDRCLREAQLEGSKVEAGGYILHCMYVALGDHDTFELFAEIK